jgi:hypothetical protein
MLSILGLLGKKTRLRRSNFSTCTQLVTGAVILVFRCWGWNQGLTYARQALCHGAIHPHPKILL